MTAQDSLKIFQNLVAQYGVNDPNLISKHMKAVSLANHSDYGQAMAGSVPSMGSIIPTNGQNGVNTPQNSVSNEPLGANGLQVPPGNEIPANGSGMA